MSWTPLSHRIHHLPLILAGPILRRTEADAVTVWLALKEPREVTLRVYATEVGNAASIKQLVLEGSRSTVALGKYLYIVAVTAKPINAHLLKPGQIYAYDLDFGDCHLLQALNSEGFDSYVTVSYFHHQLPTFAMPPDDLNHLQIVHGSCRKPHGGGRDALPILDDMIEHHANLPLSRPHQIFCSGDQIYGDDVADPLLWAVTEAGDTLLGWEENLPLHQGAKTRYQKPSELKPGQRSEIARDYAGFTAMLVNKPEKAKSHLFSLGEYYAMYLFVWSPILWSQQFPKGKHIHKDAKQAKKWDQEVFLLAGFARDLWKVRRSLANVSTYMICDDHDISDDWFLNREWCNAVLSKPLGRRAVQNGMLAYALFQAWGNTPNQFEANQPGETLLQAAKNWSASAGKDKSAWEKITQSLGIPLLEAETGLPKLKLDEDVFILERNDPDGSVSLIWHYTVRSFKHEVIVLDTRTWRGYPKEATTTPPRLLSPTGFKQQIQQPLELTDELKQTHQSQIEATLVVVPTNLVSLSIIDWVQRWDLERGKVFNSDAGDSWNFNQAGFTKLLAELFQRRDRIIILSGDIHYGSAVRLNYWFRPPGKFAEESRVMAQLTSSAFKNAEWTTHLIHTKAKSLAPELSQDWVGWHQPPELIEIQVMHQQVRMLPVEISNQRPIVRPLHSARGNGNIAWEIAIKDKNSLPDWRYHIEWIKRAKALFTPWQERKSPLKLSKPKKFGEVVSLVCHNQWVQEGEEVVGYSNLGLISFKWSDNEQTKAVIQDIYWHPAWKPNSIVFSRYLVSLQLDEPPPPPTTLSK